MSIWTDVVTTKNAYKVKLHNTQRSSEHLGKCECCGKHVVEVYTLTVKMKYINSIGTVVWPITGKVFGHEECLGERISNLDEYNFGNQGD